jgi:hypothetical protein
MYLYHTGSTGGEDEIGQIIIIQRNANTLPPPPGDYVKICFIQRQNIILNSPVCARVGNEDGENSLSER